MKKVTVLGATGSIGESTLSVLENHPDRFVLRGLAARSNWEKLLPIVEKYEVEKVVLTDPAAAEEMSKALGRPVESGEAALVDLCADSECDAVVNGLVGAVGCLPTLKALEHGKLVALANKETMVMAGPVIKKALLHNPQARITPVDSEHSAIFQCLADRPVAEVDFLQLTASGGPFRTLPTAAFENISVEEALKHPTWNMGPKITIDSASLMNKGLEVIEAHFLFDVSYDRIQVVVHPQSIVHSLVQFVDGSLMAQLGVPDMRVPIQVALSWPERWELPTGRVNLAELGQLDFEEPDLDRFPALGLAFEAGRRGGTAPAIMNAANEVVVPAFLEGKISFLQIPELIRRVLEKLIVKDEPELIDILDADRLARQTADELLAGSKE